MKFNELCEIINEEQEVIEEGWMDMWKNPKTLAALALMLGITHYNYTIPKLRQIIQDKLKDVPQEQFKAIQQKLPEQINTPRVDAFLKQLIDNTNKSWALNPRETQKQMSPNKPGEPKSNPDAFISKAYQYIKAHEGVRNEMYKDIYGNWTIGIGHLVKPEEMKLYSGRKLSDKEVEDLFVKDITNKVALIRKHFGKDFEKYSDGMKVAILDGYFRGDLSGSPKTRMLLKSRRFPEAAKEYLNNKEYEAAKKSGSGVAKRMKHNAQTIANEKI